MRYTVHLVLLDARVTLVNIYSFKLDSRELALSCVKHGRKISARTSPVSVKLDNFPNFIARPTTTRSCGACQLRCRVRRAAGGATRASRFG